MKTNKKILSVLLAVLLLVSSMAVSFTASAADFKLTYDANGGVNPPSSQTYTKSGERNISTFQPTREGYTFLGWSLDPEDWEAQYAAGGTINVDGRITLYAVWKNNAAAPYKLTYDANGGINPPSSQTYTKGGEKNISTFQPTREGYTFLGWSTDANATEAAYPSGGTIRINDRVTLYAVWQKNSAPEQPGQPDNPSQPENLCKWCGKTHDGFFQKIVGFFHNIFAAIFGAKY